MSRPWLLLLAAGCEPTKANTKPTTVDDSAVTDSATTPPDPTTPTDSALPDDDGVWTYVPVEPMVCGDGSATGIGVNQVGENPSGVVFIVEGGGLCYDDATCYGPYKKVSSLGAWGQAELDQSAASLVGPFFDRQDTNNPWSDAMWVFIPYCTGDLHIGAAEQPYKTQTTHHAGDANFAAALDRVAQEAGAANQVWVYGVSAGGFGVQVQADRFRTHWPSAEIAILADGAPLVDPEPKTWIAWTAAWDPRFPPSCRKCSGLSAALGAQLTALKDVRFGLVETWNDGTVTDYLNLADLRPPLEDLVRDHYQYNDSAQAYILEGTLHVQLAQPYRSREKGGITIADWVTAWRDAGKTFVDEYELP